MAWECVKADPQDSLDIIARMADPQDSLDMLARMTTCVKGVGTLFLGIVIARMTACARMKMHACAGTYLPSLRVPVLYRCTREDFEDRNTAVSSREKACAYESVLYAAVGMR